MDKNGHFTIPWDHKNLRNGSELHDNDNMADVVHIDCIHILHINTK